MPGVQDEVDTSLDEGFPLFVADEGFPLLFSFVSRPGWEALRGGFSRGLLTSGVDVLPSIGRDGSKLSMRLLWQYAAGRNAPNARHLSMARTWIVAASERKLEDSFSA